MERIWTGKQLEAINKKGDLLVSAAAGAGKTAVLTERIARLISEGTDPEELLVVTFTNAAAAEMKERIEARLRELADISSSEGDPIKAQRLRQAAASCERANISTLHSFCMNVLRRNYHEAGLDPAFEVAEEVDRQLLASKAMEQILEEAYEANEENRDEAFEELQRTVKSDDRLERLLYSLYAFAEAKPDPEGWLDMAAAKYTDDFPAAAKSIGDMLVNEAREELEFYLHEAERLIIDLPEEERTAAAALSSDRDIMMGFIMQNDYDRWVSGLAGDIPYARLSWTRGAADEDKAEAKAYRDAFKKCMGKLKKRFAHSLEEEEGFARLLSPPIAALKKLLLAYSERFRLLKEEAGVIDFSDMEQLTLKVLKNESIAAEYRDRFRYIFVDEYQDINPAQEAVLAAISKDNRFMVGDVKQSIYRFRQAEPGIFLEKYRGFNGSGGHFRIDLNSNFRSRTAILDAANLLFSQLMRGGRVGEIDYSDNAALVSGRERRPCDPYGEVEAVLIDPGLDPDEPPEEPFDEEYDNEEPESGASLQAEYAARRILDIMENSTIMEDGEPRRYRWSDFTVLLRSVRGSVGDWIETFARSGIPCVSSSGDGFYEALEVRLFMDLLRVIENRRQDIPLLAVMRSPIFGFTEEDLVHIKADHRSECITDSVILSAQDPASPPWSIKCGRLLSAIERWRRELKLTELGVFIRSLLDETGFAVYVSSLYGGEARRSNLETLCSQADRYSKNGGSLGGFIRYFDSARASSPSVGSAAPSYDAVKLMTIHASKGLEFPVVILGDITRKFNRRSSSDVGIFDSELGIGLCSVSGDRENRSILQRAMAGRENKRQNAEEMRLLYVAMTRAKERLILLGMKKKASAFADKLSRRLDDIRIMNADCYADWIFGAYFPKGKDLPAALEGGGEVRLEIKSPGGAAGSRAAMTEAEFEEWLQNAAFIDSRELSDRFDFSYGDPAVSSLPSKLSVTGLTLRRAEVADIPRFMQGERAFTGAEIGTLTHRLLQHISIRPHSEETIKEELDALTKRGLFTEREAEAIRIPSVTAFFGSEIGKRLITSPRVEREREFNLLMEASALTDSDSDEPILLQGVIDCCFMENGEWVLIDHKTTHVDPARDIKATAELYRRQLELYASALERLTGARVKEKYVYLLSADTAVRV